MPKIPIKKIKKSASLINRISDEIKVDLRREKLEPKQKQSFKKRLFLITILLLVILFLAWSFLFYSKNELRNLVPKEPVIFSLINQEKFYQETFPVLMENSQDIARIGEYLSQISLNFEKDIQPLFKQESVFASYSPNPETSFPFVLISEKKESFAKINDILSKIELGLKDDCNSFSQTYRQIEIRRIEPVVSSLSVFPNVYHYAQIEKYLAISNSQEILEMVIDKIIDK